MSSPRSVRWRTVMVAAATVSVLSLGLSGCAAGGGTAPSEEKDFSVLNLAAAAPVASWDPALQVSAYDGTWQWSAVYDTWLSCNQDGTVGPGAAESFEFTDDNTTLTLSLREGMTFQDGSPVDSAAVKASIEHQQASQGPDSSRVAGLTVDTPDASTAVITAPAPRGLLPTYMCMSNGIVASPTALAGGDLSGTPVSSGPYELDAAASTSGSVLSYVKRDDYWNADAYPYAKLMITIMPDVTARLNALKSGQIDGANLNGETAAEAEQSQLTLTDWVDANNGLVIFDRDGSIVPALADVRVRQAINMVFDREAIATGLFQGRATPTEQYFGPQTEAFVPELDEYYGFDVDKAKQLMDDAGYADGFDLDIPSRSPQTDAANPLIVQQLALLNIRVTETPLAAASAIPELLSGRFAMAYISTPYSAALLTAGGAMTPVSPWNPDKTTSPELAALIDAAQVQQGDELAETLKKINTYAVENAWFAPWNSRTAYFATASDVTVDGTPDPMTQIPSLRAFG